MKTVFVRLGLVLVLLVTLAGPAVAEICTNC